MHCTDVIAYHIDGEVYCLDCVTPEESESEETGVVFADNLDSEVGATCGNCYKCLDDNGEWISHEDITNNRLYRWSRCASCNEQKPWDTNGFDYRKNRLLALQGRLECHNCSGRVQF